MLSAWIQLGLWGNFQHWKRPEVWWVKHLFFEMGNIVATTHGVGWYLGITLGNALYYNSPFECWSLPFLVFLKIKKPNNRSCFVLVTFCILLLDRRSLNVHPSSLECTQNTASHTQKRTRPCISSKVFGKSTIFVSCGVFVTCLSWKMSIFLFATQLAEPRGGMSIDIHRELHALHALQSSCCIKDTRIIFQQRGWQQQLTGDP